MMLGSPCSPCCATTPTTCDYSTPAQTDLVTVSVDSSVYGPSLKQSVYGEQYPVASKTDSHTGNRWIEYFGLKASYLISYPFFDFLSSGPSYPWEGAATWARFYNVQVATFCRDNGEQPNSLDGIVRVRFYGFVLYRSLPFNLSATVNGTQGQQLTDSRLGVDSISEEIAFTLPAGFVVENVAIAYQFTDTSDQLFSSQSLPASETLTFRGFYDANGNQLMYQFGENFPLP